MLEWLPGAGVFGVVLTSCGKLKLLSVMWTRECHGAGHNGTRVTLVVDIGVRQPKSWEVGISVENQSDDWVQWPGSDAGNVA